jgi:hypothetical protein
MTYQLNEYQEKWLQDLETTKEAQGQGFLHYIDYDGETTIDKWCCLGRGCYIIGLKSRLNNIVYVYPNANVNKSKNEIGSYAPMQVVAKLQLRSEAGDLKIPHNINGNTFQTLSEMNDNGMTFKEIAAYIRSNLDNVFI